MFWSLPQLTVGPTRTTRLTIVSVLLHLLGNAPAVWATAGGIRFIEPQHDDYQVVGRAVTIRVEVDSPDDPAPLVTLVGPWATGIRLEHRPYVFIWTNPPPGVWPVTAWVGGLGTQTMVTVLPPGGLPWIVQEPKGVTAPAGTNVVLDVTAVSLSPGLTYQWRFHATNLPGATNAFLELHAVNADQAGPYSVVVSNPSGATPSLTAWVTVHATQAAVDFQGTNIYAPGPGLPQLMGSPYWAELWTGPSPYEMAPTGPRTPMNAGRFNGGVRQVPITVPGAPLYCQVQFFYGRTGWEPALLSNLLPYPTPFTTLSNLIAPNYIEWPEPLISTVGHDCDLAPGNLLVGEVAVATAGDDVRMCVQTFANGSTLYEWRMDGVPIPGSAPWLSPGEPHPDYPSISLLNVQPSHVGTYSVLGSNNLNVVVNKPTRLLVLHPPWLASFPVSTSAVAGVTLPLDVVMEGAGPFTFQWRRDGVPLPAATGMRLLLAPLSLADAGFYDVVVGTVAGTIVSPRCRVEVVNPSATNIVLQLRRNEPGLYVIKVLAGTAPAVVEVQGSANLLHWESLGLVTNVAGEGTLIQPATPVHPHRFFRAVTPGQ